MEYHTQMALRLHQLMRFHIDELNAMFNVNCTDISFMESDRSHEKVLLSFSQCYHALYLLQQKIKVLHHQVTEIEMSQGTPHSLHSKFLFHPVIHKPWIQSSFASNPFPPLYIFPQAAIDSSARGAFSLEPTHLFEESLSSGSSLMKMQENRNNRHGDHQNQLSKELKMNAKIRLNASAESSSSEDDGVADKLPTTFPRMFDSQRISKRLELEQELEEILSLK